MGMGKIIEALRCIEDNTVGSVLKVNDIIDLPNRNCITVLDQLKQLHPPGQREVSEALIHDYPESTLLASAALFDTIEAATIKKMPSRVKCLLGLTVLTYAWKRMGTTFVHASNNLYHALVAVARKLCKQTVDPSGLAPSSLLLNYTR